MATPGGDGSLERGRHVRGLLATLRAIIQCTATGQLSVKEYVSHLNGRLGAIARVQAILLRGHDPVDLAELLTDELLSQGVPLANVDLPQDSLLVDRRVGAAFALVLHELATNAIKFGSLRAPAPRLAVRWHSEGRPDGWATFEWLEESVAQAPATPLVGGFGFKVIRQMLPEEIGARTRIEFTATGLACVIRFPMHPDTHF